MKQTTLIFLGASVILIMLILISVASFFIISELTNQGSTNQESQTTIPPIVNQNINSQPIPATSTAGQTDANNNGVPDDVEQILNSNNSPTSTTASNPSAADANGNGIPDDVEKILKPNTKSPAAKPAPSATDANNNGIPDDVEKILGN